MRHDLPLSRQEVAWRRKHEPKLHAPAPLGHRLERAVLRAVAPATAVPPGPHGFDVSSYQPAGPNFRAGGRSFGIFKATESTGYFDKNFGANRAAAHAQGCSAVGIYHFARPGSTNPDAQANYFLAHVGARQPGEFAVLDYEVPPFDPNWAARYMQVLQQHGWQCAFYTYAGMAAGNSTAPIRAATNFYWPAAYSTSPPSADRWADVGWTLWQHTDGQYFADGPWDCSVANAGLLAQLAQGGSPPAPPTPPPGQEEPVGAFALPPLGPGETYTFRPPPAEGAGAVKFGAVFVSFGADFGDPAVPGASVPLRLAYWNTTTKGWVVAYGEGAYDKNGKWTETNPSLPPLYVPTMGDILALQWHKDMTKCSVVHLGRAGRVVPTIEFQAG